ncbi:MAG: hypothetical protein RRB13_01665 [bacterium]|nr:hypothetical protein [bacterium]
MFKALLLCALLLTPTLLQAAQPLRDGRRSAYLRALGFERRGDYSSAQDEYRRLPVDSSVRQSQLYLLTLERHPRAPAPNAEALAHQVRYLTYQGFYGAAFAALTQKPGSAFKSAELDQQRALLALWFGDLALAQSFLKGAQPKQEALQLEHLVLEFWLEFLKREDAKALAVAHQMREKTLYLPWQSLPLSAEEMDRWVLLYPSSSTLLDQLVEQQVASGDWKGLDQLCHQQQNAGLPSPKTSYCQLGQRLGWKLPYRQLSPWVLASQLRPEWLELLAQRAIRQGDWVGLDQLGQDYQKLYPQLEDGRLYRELAVNRSSEGSTGSLLDETPPKSSLNARQSAGLGRGF